MEKRISFDKFQSVKRVAQACNPLIVKGDKIKEQMERLQAEYNYYDTQVACLEAGIKAVIGFRVEELVKKVIEPGIDANGQPKKTTKYLPTNIVSYDEDRKQFVITVPDEDALETEGLDESHNDDSPIEEMPDDFCQYPLPESKESPCDDVSTSSDFIKSPAFQ